MGKTVRNDIRTHPQSFSRQTENLPPPRVGTPYEETDKTETLNLGSLLSNSPGFGGRDAGETV